MRPRPARRARRSRLSYVSFGRARAPWRRLFGLLFALATLIAAPLAARAQGSGADSVSLTWTAPGDDGGAGTAATYDLRMSGAPITMSNWSQATPVSGVPAPQASGSTQRVVVHGLTRGALYYFAMRTADEAGNWSLLSNVARCDWIFDTAPPAAPTGLHSALQGATVRLQWNANTEANLAGYSVYRAASAAGPWTRASDTLLAGPQFDDSAVPAGWSQAVYEVTASSAAGYESARSASITVTFAASTPGAIALAYAYPNPCGSGGPVHLSVVVPPAGVAGARLDVFDSGGHRVRRIDLAPLAGGNQLVTWDGHNQFGRAVAPGVYTLRLDAGGEVHRARVVRTP